MELLKELLQLDEKVKTRTDLEQRTKSAEKRMKGKKKDRFRASAEDKKYED